MISTEQQAKELLDEIVDAVCDGQIPTRQALKDAIGVIVAAALAACAREATKELRVAMQEAIEWEENYRVINNLGKRGPDWVQMGKQAMERAAGEKA